MRRSRPIKRLASLMARLPVGALVPGGWPARVEATVECHPEFFLAVVVAAVVASRWPGHQLDGHG